MRKVTIKIESNNQIFKKKGESEEVIMGRIDFEFTGEDKDIIAILISLFQKDPRVKFYFEEALRLEKEVKIEDLNKEDLKYSLKN